MMVPGTVSWDEVPKKLKQNINTVYIHILTLMVAFRDGTIYDVATKVGTITKLGVCPGPSLKPSLNIMMQLGGQLSTGNL